MLRIPDHIITQAFDILTRFVKLHFSGPLGSWIECCFDLKIIVSLMNTFIFKKL